MGEELESLDKFAAGFVAALDAEADQTAEAALEVLLRHAVVGARLEPGVVDPGDFGMRREELGDRESVGAGALHAEVQRLQTL
ncbi:hypothetical protein D3C83_155950 [compost metagenome]